MSHVIPIPTESIRQLKTNEETGFGYHVVSVHLKDGRHFDQVVVSECCIIAVRGYDEVPFTEADVQWISVNHKKWNFREGSDARRWVARALSASA